MYTYEYLKKYILFYNGLRELAVTSHLPPATWQTYLELGAFDIGSKRLKWKNLPKCFERKNLFVLFLELV